MENVVCCVCDAVGLSKPAETGSRAVTGNCELVFREFVYPRFRSLPHARPESARVGARDGLKSRYAPGNDET